MELLSTRLFVKAISVGAGARTADAGRTGLSVSASQNLTGVVITIAEGASRISGKALPASERDNLPEGVRVYLIPAEPQAADDMLRYNEIGLNADGSFSLRNIAPGKYFLLAEPVSEPVEQEAPRVAWDAAYRARLLAHAQALNNLIDLKPCQRLADQVVKVSPTKSESKSRKPVPKDTQRSSPEGKP